MKTKAAVLTGPNRPFEIMELELDGPRAGEVLLRYVASGLCHSDLHMVDGNSNPRFPLVPGHEGSAIVEEVGAGVTRVVPGDHVVCSFVPSCGVCRYCSTGHHNLCDLAAFIREGCMPDGTFRFHRNGIDYGAGCFVGTFSERATVPQQSVVKIDPWLPLEAAALVGCGVATGWGGAVYTAGVRPGDTVVVYGSGGIGINAVQGAAYAGAKYVVVVDPVQFKRDTALKMGATHAFADSDQAATVVNDLTWGHGADHALVMVGTPDAGVISAAFDIVGRRGTVVLTALAHPDTINIQLSGSMLTLYEKTIKGSVFGSANPQYDIVRLLRLYDAGQLKLDELVTNTYSLEQINQGYQDLRDGKNIRGVILHDTE
ncbi:NDMA-dependent alcohol dehydrogenase [Rhodococcus sp. LB1]|uniref:NDMA-dependent alcohol dehydrogenase n=1 Tax=Rhodococcus sp. LB1 TaxID=1807499 RepID=UPI00077A535C|nr:NDMA-dependent alcohol dehydrogenase [Rhodococcus sp. LB1]KXX60426.1 alcohol dehydrogenase [Rhodococcus sp. LB1]